MKKNKIDALNDAFISIAVEERSRGYQQYIKAINTELIENIETLTPDKAREIINKQEPNIGDTSLLFLIYSAVMISLTKRLSKQEKSDLTPILALIDGYSIRNEKRFARQVLKIANGVGLNEREKIYRQGVMVYAARNKKVLIDARTRSVTHLRVAQRKAKLTKRVLSDYIKLRDENKPIKTIQKSLIRKYNNETNIKRALETEIHAQAEYVRKEHAKGLGYTHKIWKTQGDTRVRHTKFHNQVTDKRIPIDSEFRAAGEVAQQPGDTRLPPSERIRCRCYLDYE